ncbi:MAG: MlaA family lipoprotein [Methylovulum sp.]|jgi:phospholipid-binding lipoprotein MlaA
MTAYLLNLFALWLGKKRVFYFLSLVFVVISGCASQPVLDHKSMVKKIDPYENINRKVFVFNDYLDEYLAEPISNAYQYVAPQFVKNSIFNFYTNLRNFNVIFNDVLQAKFKQSAKDSGRLVVNTSLGLLGLFDVAKDLGFEQNDEDFDQTLAVWGVPEGPYLVLPIVGPLTLRGVPGAMFDTATNPTSYIGAPIQLLSILNARANAEGALKFIDEAALDPYLFTRESFLQWRRNLSSDGQENQSLDLDEELDESALNSTSTLPELRNSFKASSLIFDKTIYHFEKAVEDYRQAESKLNRFKK